MTTFPNHETLVADAESVLGAIELLSDIRALRNREAVKIRPEVANLFSVFGSSPVQSKPVVTSQYAWSENILSLGSKYIKRLEAVLRNPCDETWSDTQGICIRPGKTLWQIIIEIDPTFPMIGPKSDQHGNRIQNWSRIPSVELLRQALGLPASIPEAGPAKKPVAHKSYEPVDRRIEAAAMSVVSIDAASQRAPMRDVVFEPYVCQRLRVEGACEHPTPLVESAAMASVVPPAATYSPMLPRELIDKGLLSIAQLEAIVYAGQAHSQYIEPQLVTLLKPEFPTVVREEKIQIATIHRLRHWLSNGSFVDEAVNVEGAYREPVFKGFKFATFENLSSLDIGPTSLHDNLQAAIGSFAVKEKAIAFRKGWYCADSTGLGKGRIICGSIIDSFARGAKKAVWISKTPKLVKDAIRDWTDLGGNKDEIIPLAKIGAADEIVASRGILFLTYGLLKSASKDGAELEPIAPGAKEELESAIIAEEKASGNYLGEREEAYYTKNGSRVDAAKEQWIDAKDRLAAAIEAMKVKPKKGKTRLQQVIDWLGTDFDGIIAADEAHQMKSSLSVRKARGHTDVSLAAAAGCDLQTLLPDAKFIYASATGATEVANLAYCDRLGIWGRGTPFPNKSAFVAQIEGGGVAAMELVARDLKMRGLYLARSLSFDGVEYDRLIHVLSPDQRAMYDKLCTAWQVILKHIDKALEMVAMTANGKVDGKTKGAAYSAFWGTHQRFFNTLLVAMQMPAVIADIEVQLAAGNCAVLQLVNTQEAMMERQLAKLDADDDLTDIDMTPRDMLAQMLEHCFPVAQTEQFTDANGKARVRPVTDAAGNAVLNKQAVAMREQLLMDVGTLTCPDGPMEMVINHFGVDMVAEVTGRGRRVVRKMMDGVEKTAIENRSPIKCMAEAADFQDGKRRILIFSDAGGTGASYHASRTVKNQSRRYHYLVQAGWIADVAVQGFGRTHRSNQVCEPMYKLVSTDLKGQKRFISTIARRLDQLGALTKGQRQAATQGLFTAADNLESEYARAALYQLYRDIYNGLEPRMSLADFLEQTGLELTNDEGQLREDLPPVTRFLNRLLSLQIEKQNNLFDAYAERIEAKIRKAMLDGIFDVGVETIMADSCVKVSEAVVNVDAASGAETKHVHLSLRHKSSPWTFDQIVSFGEATHYQKVAFFAQNKRSEKVYAFCDAGSRTLPNGSVVESYYQVGPVTRKPIAKAEVDPSFSPEKDHFRRLTPKQAAELWAEQVKTLPNFTEEDLHLITGAILPIWDRLKGSPRVKRVATDDGERMLGRVIPEEEVFDTLARLGVNAGASSYPIAEVTKRLMQGTHRFVLANGWVLKRSKVGTDHRIELTCGELGEAIPFDHFAALKQDGLFYERVNWKVRFYVPTDTRNPALTEKVIKTLTKNRPVAKSVRLERGGDEAMVA